MLQNQNTMDAIVRSIYFVKTLQTKNQQRISEIQAKQKKEQPKTIVQKNFKQVKKEFLASYDQEGFRNELSTCVEKEFIFNLFGERVQKLLKRNLKVVNQLDRNDPFEMESKVPNLIDKIKRKNTGRTGSPYNVSGTTMATDNDKARAANKITIQRLDTNPKIRIPSSSSPNDCMSPYQPTPDSTFIREKGGASDNSQDIVSGPNPGMTHSQIEDFREEMKTADRHQSFDALQDGSQRQIGRTHYLRRSPITNPVADVP